MKKIKREGGAKITDIVIATKKETLDHKRGKDGYQRYFWYLHRLPKKLKEGDRIHFAVNKKIQGSFKVDDIDPVTNEIEWDKDTWKKEKKNIPSKVRQGFAYRWW